MCTTDAGIALYSISWGRRGRFVYKRLSFSLLRSSVLNYTAGTFITRSRTEKLHENRSPLNIWFDLIWVCLRAKVSLLAFGIRIPSYAFLRGGISYSYPICGLENSFLSADSA